MPSLSLPSDQRRRLASLLWKARDREIGGILMGEQLAPGRFMLVDFSVDETSGSAGHFVCSPEHHQGALEAFFTRAGADYRRFNYLGEWHSHPRFPTSASATDVASMQGLVRSERDIPFAMLMIVRLRYAIRLQISATMFSRHRSPEPVQVDAVRPWPAAEPTMRRKDACEQKTGDLERDERKEGAPRWPET